MFKAGVSVLLLKWLDIWYMIRIVIRWKTLMGQGNGMKSWKQACSVIAYNSTVIIEVD